MTLTAVLYIIIVHWIADFVFQDVDWANNKSKSNFALYKHVLTYSGIWLFASCVLFGIDNAYDSTYLYVLNSIWFFGITFGCHFITDYITSRIVSRMFREQKYGTHIPNFGAFTVIGIDQVMHYFQLFLTYRLLTS